MAEVKEEFVQKLDEESGYYLKMEKESGEVVKRKTTPGPYKGIPILGEEKEEEKIEKVPPKPVEKVEKKAEKVEEFKSEETPKRVFISLDDSIDKIVYLDQRGVDLFFEDDPDKFRELPEGVLDSLSKINRERYQASFDFYKRRVRERDNPEEFATPGISVNPNLTSARARLAIEGKVPGFHYCWKAPHELTTAARLGYRIAKRPGLKTFAHTGEETHKVSAFGEDELVLTEIPESSYNAILKHASDKSKRRVGGIEDSGAAEIRAVGGIPFRPGKTPDGRNWSPSPGPNLNEMRE